MRPKLDLPNCLAILRACRKRPRTVEELRRLTGMSRPTLYRTLTDLREQLGVRLGVQITDGEAWYVITDSGLIDSERL